MPDVLERGESGVLFVPFVQLTGEAILDISRQLPLIVHHSYDNLIGSFPNIARRYITPDRAAESLILARERMNRQMGDGYFVIQTAMKDVLGMAWYEQGAVVQQRKLFGLRTVVEGPQIAMWLRSGREASYRGLSGEIGRKLLPWVIADKSTIGHMWAVVEEANPVRRTMPEEMPETGKIEYWGKGRWHAGDGVAALRHLYVTARTLEAMRQEAV